MPTNLATKIHNAHTNAYTDTNTNKQTTYRLRDTIIDTQTQIPIHRHNYRYTDKNTDTQTQIQVHRHTY